MKKLILLSTMLFSFCFAKAQSTFSDMTDVITFMENKTYYNSDMDTELEFGYISSFNTYGIKLKSNSSGRSMYFINCDINAYGSFADVSGMSSSDGSNFKFRLYKTKIVVGVGEQRQATFYPKDSMGNLNYDSNAGNNLFNNQGNSNSVSVPKTNKSEYVTTNYAKTVPDSFLGKFVQGNNSIIISKSNGKPGLIVINNNGEKYTAEYGTTVLNLDKLEFLNSEGRFSVFGLNGNNSKINDIDVRINIYGDNWNTDSDEYAKKIRFHRQ